MGNYPSPKQPKVRRLLAGFDTDKFEQTIPQNQQQIRREPDPEEVRHIDGKQPIHGSGDAVLTAVTSPSRSYLGSALVPTKKNDKIREHGRFLRSLTSTDESSVSTPCTHRIKPPRPSSLRTVPIIF